jgi:D-serine deaminase-like pyridoxal phosphate-dependent protein
MVQTPHLSIDGAKMKKNIEKMAAIVERNGVALGPADRAIEGSIS